MKTYTTPSEAYIETLRDILEAPDFRSAPRGQQILEKMDYSFRVTEPNADPIETKDSERNAVIRDYTAKEVQLYNSATNLTADFAKASKFWDTIGNSDGTVNSAYGYLIWKNKSHGNPKFESGECMRTPWEWCLDSLKADKDTRQAILRFSLPEHAWKGVKDFTCTLSGNFLIRDDKLHFSVVMRSNDMWLGLTYDLPWFMSLMDKMVEELKPTYPNLTKGHYTHFVHSLHIYERNKEAVKKALGLGL